jgi:hypothetical protein
VSGITVFGLAALELFQQPVNLHASFESAFSGMTDLQPPFLQAFNPHRCGQKSNGDGLKWTLYREIHVYANMIYQYIYNYIY